MESLRRIVLETPHLLLPWLDLIRVLSNRSEDVPAVLLIEQYNELNEVFERAVTHLPYSYKLWLIYIDSRLHQAKRLGLPDTHFIASLFERALEKLPQMPNLWLRYAAFCEGEGWVTRTRLVFENALSTLPPTQHMKVWQQYKAFLASGDKAIDVMIPVMKRYLMFDTSFKAQVEYIGMLADRGCSGDVLSHAANVLVKQYRSHIAEASGFWSIIAMCLGALNDAEDGEKQQERVSTADAISLVSCGVEEYPPGATALRTALGCLLGSRGEFLLARQVLEESIDASENATDFFDSLAAITEFEYSLMSKVVETEGSMDKGTLKLLYPTANTIDDAFSHLQRLVVDHQLLYNTTMLRNEPTFVAYWLKRAELTNESHHKNSSDDATRRAAVIAVYKDACSKLESFTNDVVSDDDDEKEQGSKQQEVSFAAGLPVYSRKELFVAWSKFLRDEGDVEGSFSVLEQGALYTTFSILEENEALFCLLMENMFAAQRPPHTILSLAERATNVPPLKKKRKELFSKAAQQRPLWRARGVWHTAMDAIVALGTKTDLLAFVAKMKKANMFSTCIAIDVANALVHKFEDKDAASRSYEASLLCFEDSRDKMALFKEYVHLLVTYECPTSIERCRDVFEDALCVVGVELTRRCPLNRLLDCYGLFEAYRMMEETHGFYNNSIKVAERACDVFDDHRVHSLAVDHLLEALEKFEGSQCAADATLQHLNDFVKRRQTTQRSKRVGQLALRYARLCEGSGDHDQARSILSQCSILIAPSILPFFWSGWEEFEARCGSARSLRDLEVHRANAQAQHAAASRAKKPELVDE